MAAPAQPQSPPEKSEFAGGPYRDSMGHSFKTSQALAGHIKQTGHMPIVAPPVMSRFQSQMQQFQEYIKDPTKWKDTSILADLFGPSEPPKEPKPEEMKFKHFPVKFPVRVKKNADGTVTVIRIPTEDIIPDKYQRVKLLDAIYEFVQDTFIEGKTAMDEATEKVLRSSSLFTPDESHDLSQNFMMWSSGSIGMDPIRQRIRDGEDDDLLKFKDYYWEFFQKTIDQYERIQNQVNPTELADFKEIKKSINPDGTIKLYRGVKIPVGEDFKDEDFDKLVKGEMELGLFMNTVDSWTASKHTAKRFAGGQFQPQKLAEHKRRGILLEYDADPQEILMGWPFIGLTGEAEFALNIKKTEERIPMFRVTHWEKSGTNLYHVKIKRAENAKAHKMGKGRISSKVYVDNPHGDWLETERARAAEAAKDPSPGLHRVAGSPTASIAVAHYPTEVIAKLPGIMDEHKHYDQKKIDHISEIMAMGGFRESEPIFINVSYDGKAYINEGNHRAQAALKAGLKEVPIEIKYFAGGEEADGEFKLEEIELEKALYSSKRDKIYWDLTGRNDYAIEKQRGLTAPTAIAMAKAYINGPYRIRITRTKRGYTLSLLPPEKMMVSWLEKPVRGIRGSKGIQE